MFATAGRPEPELPPPAPPVGPRVAMAVGKTKDGESLPAKPGGHCYYRQGAGADGTRIPSFEYPVPLQACVSTQSQCSSVKAQLGSLLVHDNGGGLGRHRGYGRRCAGRLELLERARWKRFAVRREGARVQGCSLEVRVSVGGWRYVDAPSTGTHRHRH